MDAKRGHMGDKYSTMLTPIALNPWTLDPTLHMPSELDREHIRGALVEQQNHIGCIEGRKAWLISLINSISELEEPRDGETSRERELRLVKLYKCSRAVPRLSARTDTATTDSTTNHVLPNVESHF
jgi:hypothetical protein